MDAVSIKNQIDLIMRQRFNMYERRERCEYSKTDVNSTISN